MYVYTALNVIWFHVYVINSRDHFLCQYRTLLI